MPPTPDREPSIKTVTKDFVAHEIREALRAQENDADYKSVEMIADDIYNIFDNRYHLEVFINNN